MGVSESKQAQRVEVAKEAGAAAAAEVLKARCTEKKETETRPEKETQPVLPELVYFDGPGRGQLTRLAFAAGNIDFIDTRVSFASWPALKSNPESIPARCFGSMPCIGHGDTLVAQSRATAVYAAELGIWAQGRLGSEPTQQAINGATEMMVLGAHADLQAAMYKCLFSDEESKAKGKEELPDKIKPTLEGLERALGRKTCGGPFFFSESGPTLADLAVYDFIESPFPGLKALGIDLAPYAKLVAVAEAVSKDEKVKSNFLDQAIVKAPAPAPPAAKKTCCPPGSHPYLKATYTGTGSVVTEGDVEFYISKSTESPKSAVLLLPDIWGWNGGRVRAIADYWANQGYMAIIPKLLTPVFEGGTDGDAMSPTSQFNMDWIKNFPWSVQKPKVDTALKLCKDKGIVKIAVLGFCYGGHPASWASSENPDLVVCGAVFHPSMQLETFAFGGNMGKLMKDVQCPFLIAPAGNDLEMFAEDTDFGKALKSSAKGSQCVWKPYPEMEHGWSCRGDIADAKIKRDCEDVMKEATEFFAKYL